MADTVITREDLIANFQPIGNYLLVEVSGAKEKSTGGIVLVQSAQAPSARGVVLKVGLGQKNGLNGALIGMSLMEGDEILFHPSGLQEYEIEGIRIPMLHEGDVMGYWRGGIAKMQEPVPVFEPDGS